ncbi:MAG: carboxypeptidase regulatory-like domain-containing protein [Acidobacteria bacterium]|nr:carboxypeptidase regulatory-like domain-containing protein [Acidobacteriota bacterium]
MRTVALATLCLLVLCAGERLLPAQSVSAIIKGRVTDASSGAVAGARISIRDTDRGLVYTANTDSAGRYQAAVPAGNYEAEAVALGLAPAKTAGVVLTVNQILIYDFTLQVSGVREVIEVTAEAPLVDATSGTISGLVDRQRLSQLPLNGRDFSLLTLLEPGIVPNNTGAVNTPFGGKWSNFLVNGQIDQSTLFLVDGADINDLFSGRTPGGSNGLLLGLDSVQEFRVLLNNYRAEFGRNSGGVINVATRSGSNQFHGSVYEYLRNSALDAKNFFDFPTTRIPAFRRNQFGASLGGPVRRDRTFFFVNYEALREAKGITSVSTVPSAAARRGIFPDPASPGRTIPVAISPAVVPFLQLYPLPNLPENADGKTAGLLSIGNQPTQEDYGLARLDHRWNENTSIVARVAIQNGSSTIAFHGSPVPGFPDEVPHRNIYSMVGATSAIGSSAVNEFHFAFNRTGEDILLPPAPGGLSLTPFPGRSLGVLAVGGLSNIGNQVFAPFGVKQNVFETVENFSYRRGRHSQKYGGSVQRYQANEYRGTFFNGQYTFAGLPQFPGGPIQQFLAGAPNSWLGVLGGTNAGNIASPAGWRWTALNLFAQDDFQVAPNLTLNLGIRYEFTNSPVEVNGRMANLRSPLDAQITIGEQLFNSLNRSIAPRFGFAWNLFGNSRSVLRGGYGIFHNPLVVNMFGNSRLVPPFVRQVVIALPSFPDPLAAGRTPAQSTTGQSISYDLSQPYAQEWNLLWEQQIARNVVAKAAYVGNRSLHLIRSLEANPATPTILPDGRKFFAPGLPRRNPNFGPIRGRSSDGNSWYNALQLSLERRYRAGWTIQGSYTWSKSLSTSDSSFTAFPNQPSNAQDPTDPFLDKGPSAFDVRHRLVLHFIYETPSWGQWRSLLGGWIFSGVASLSTAYPFTVIDGFNRSGNLQTDNSIADRPNWNPNFQRKVILADPARWFDPAAFVLQPAGFYGDVGRNALRGPAFANLDLSLNKTVTIRDSHQFEFRADVFNLLNHPNFATPSSPTAPQVNGGVIVFPDASGVPAGSAGQIFRTVTDSRQIQFSLRYRF